jgi:2-polyprenyl-3-methyl-5-hydroxy-6-metoxy-1,4-benzoquinol methylase
MDDPALSPERHAAALRGLARLNLASGAARILWPAIVREAHATGSRPVRVLDLATGSGDLPISLVRRARRAGVGLSIHGCDVSPVAVASATARAERAGWGGEGEQSTRFYVLDVLNDIVPDGYDIIMCSLFMHHLSDEQVVSLLYKMRCAARMLVLVSDLERRRDGLLLAWSASRLLTRSDVVHTDAMLSVRAAFSIDEFAVLASNAGLDGARLERRWPCRFLLEWSRP